MSEILLLENFSIIKIKSFTFGEFVSVIDSDDFERCSTISWSVNKFCNNYYCVNNKIGLLHRFISLAEENEEIDHVDGDTMNNRKENLRPTNRLGNMRNRKLHENNKSGKAGVIKYGKRWMAYIKLNGIQKNLGYFNDFEEAVNARKIAETKYYGEFLRNKNSN